MQYLLPENLSLNFLACELEEFCAPQGNRAFEGTRVFGGSTMKQYV